MAKARKLSQTVRHLQDKLNDINVGYEVYKDEHGVWCMNVTCSHCDDGDINKRFTSMSEAELYREAIRFVKEHHGDFN